MVKITKKTGLLEKNQFYKKHENKGENNKTINTI